MGIQTILGGRDVSEYVQDGSVTHRWQMNLDEAVVRLPMELAGADESAELAIYLDGALDFRGTVELIEDQGGVSEMSTVYTAISPDFIYDMRYCMDVDGDFSDPDFLQTLVYGPQIAQALLANTNAIDGPTGIGIGTIVPGTTPMIGAPRNWPMTLGQMYGLFASTGEVDFVHEYTTGSNLANLSVYPGNYGADLSGSTVFRYATGTTSNCQTCRRIVDKREIRNKIWDYLGPREDLQRWLGGNITASEDVPGQPGNPLNSPPYAAAQAIIKAKIASSRSAFRARMLVQQFEQFQNAPEAFAAKALYFLRWQAESYLRAGPKVLVELQPDPGIAPTFGCGDFIGVEAGPTYRGGGFSGRQRVMEYSYRWDTAGIVQLGSPIGQPGVPSAPAIVASMSGERPTSGTRLGIE